MTKIKRDKNIYKKKLSFY